MKNADPNPVQAMLIMALTPTALAVVVTLGAAALFTWGETDTTVRIAMLGMAATLVTGLVGASVAIGTQITMVTAQRSRLAYEREQWLRQELVASRRDLVRQVRELLRRSQLMVQALDLMARAEHINQPNRDAARLVGAELALAAAGPNADAPEWNALAIRVQVTSRTLLRVLDEHETAFQTARDLYEIARVKYQVIEVAVRNQQMPDDEAIEAANQASSDADRHREPLRSAQTALAIAIERYAISSDTDAERLMDNASPA